MFPSDVVQWNVALGSSEDDAVSCVVGVVQLIFASGPASTSGTSVNVPVTKSFRVASMDCEERVSARNDEKQTFVMPNCVKFIPPSKNAPGGKMLAAPCDGV